MRQKMLRTACAIAALVALTVGATGCAESKRGSNASSKDKTLIFATPGEPKVLDPSLATDGETFRPARQIMETLIQHEPGGTRLIGMLAETWEMSPDGTAWTFTLRKGVKFHDGTDFNGEAVCKNFERWYHYSGLYQNVAEYWLDTFGGFAKNEDADAPTSNYAGCTSSDPTNVVIKVKKPTSRLPGAFTLSSFSIQSPKALESYAAESMSGNAENLTYPKYALEQAVGTGPFTFNSWDRANKRLTMVRNDAYWGEKAKIGKLIFRQIADENARRQALEAGEINGYDLVAPADIATLIGKKFQVPTRSVFNILYLGMGQHNPRLLDPRVRKALAHAVDRDALVKSKLPQGASIANQFMPDTLEGHAEDVPTYSHDVDKAKSLLREAGAEGMELKFYYPTEVTRPYMPNPKDIFEIVKAGLEEAGVKVIPVPEKWSPTYLDDVRSGKADLWLLGWTGDYNEGYNFIGTFFGRKQDSWSFDNPELFAALANVDAEPDRNKRIAMYKVLNKQIMEFLPGLPLASSPPSFALAKNIRGMNPSPLTDERFATVDFAN